jgi:hypothetical protein
MRVWLFGVGSVRVWVCGYISRPVLLLQVEQRQKMESHQRQLEKLQVCVSCVCVCVPCLPRCMRACIRACQAESLRVCACTCVRVVCVRAYVCAHVYTSLTMVLAGLSFFLWGLSEELYGAYMCVCNFELAHMTRLD